MQTNAEGAVVKQSYDNSPYWKRVLIDIKRSPALYVILVPVIAYYFLFSYKPMYGVLIAFKQYRPGRPIMDLNWVGFAHFIRFFQSSDFQRVLFNTIKISVASIMWGFWPPIVLALLLNELRSRKFSRVVQTVTYMPHFISAVVIAGMILRFTDGTGVITQLMLTLGILEKPIALLSRAAYFLPVYIVSGIWQGIGFGSIIYLAALTNISQELFEAAKIDGAGRWKQTLHITLPGILPTITILFILRMGRIMSTDTEMILLLYNSAIYSTSDVIGTFVYRSGLVNARYDFSTAVGLFNSVINLIFLIITNFISRKLSETSLW